MAKKKVHASRKVSGKSSQKKHAKPADKARSRGAAKAGAAAKSGKSTAAEFVRWVHATLDKLIDTYPVDKATYQVAGTDNHLLWTVGHLAVTYKWFTGLLGGSSAPLPEGYDRMFGYQSKPTGDAAAYPSLTEVTAHYKAAYAGFTDAMDRLKPADLAKPPVADSFGFANTRQDVLLRAGWHDGWHSGQLSTLRRAMGLPPIM